MKRQEFNSVLNVEQEKIKALFSEKNQAYGAGDDVFYNFRQTAQRELPELYKENPHAAMFKVAEILVDKHNVALAKGIDVHEARSRLQDRVVYSLLQIAMIEEAAAKGNCEEVITDAR